MSSARDPSSPVAAGPPLPPGHGREPAEAQALEIARAPASPSSSAPAAGRALDHQVPGFEPRPRDLLRRRQPLSVPEPETGVAAVYAKRSGAARLEALKAGGGSAETEAAVLAGLRYLQSRQQGDGAWGETTRDRKYGDVRGGKTGLALLAFLGSGFTHQVPGSFQGCVSRGLSFLLAEQDSRTGHLGDGSAYSHGIAAYALAEAYAMSRDEQLRKPLQRAVDRILRAQISRPGHVAHGGWPYFYRNPRRSFDPWPRLSVTVWQVMALESARIGGLEVPEAALERARHYVLQSYDEELRSFRYTHSPEWRRNAYQTLPGSVAAGVFALELLGGPGGDRRYADAVRYVMDRRPAGPWRRVSQDAFVRQGRSNEYFLYYGTLGMRLHGGPEWESWNGALKELLLPSQDEDGSWRPVSYYVDYARDTDHDRSYTTAMCVLMLEVYYRYDTPLLKKLAREALGEGR